MCSLSSNIFFTDLAHVDIHHAAIRKHRKLCWTLSVTAVAVVCTSEPATSFHTCYSYRHVQANKPTGQNMLSLYLDDVSITLCWCRNSTSWPFLQYNLAHVFFLFFCIAVILISGSWYPSIIPFYDLSLLFQKYLVISLKCQFYNLISQILKAHII